MKRSFHRHVPFGLNMTPMIDVVFQLLVFFVCTVEFQKMEDVLPANVAASPAGQRQAQKTTEELDLGPIDIEVSAAGITARFQGRIKSFDRPAAEETLAAVRNQLKSWLDIERRLPVRIAGRADVATGLLLRVYDTTLEAGAVHVSLSPAELP